MQVLLRPFFRILKQIAHYLGYRLFVVKDSVNPEYEPIYPLASYAPWKIDTDFQKIYALVFPHTLVDKYRCFELWQLVKESRKCERGALIEVGAWQGGTAALIARSALDAGITDTVYVCDTFTGVVKATNRDSAYEGGEHADTSLQIVENLMKRADAGNVKVLKGIFPEDTGKDVTDEVFRFCHIDVDVYQSAKDVLSWVWPRLIVGGIVVFDDYGFKGCDGITALVHEEREKNDRVVLYNLTGHAVMVKTKL